MDEPVTERNHENDFEKDGNRNLDLRVRSLFSLGWSEQGNLSLSVNKAEAYTRLHVWPHYAAGAVYAHSEGLSWYAVRAYYWDGPWSGPGYSYAGWTDYAARNGIACTPGTAVHGGDGIMYNCQ